MEFLSDESIATAQASVIMTLRWQADRLVKQQQLMNLTRDPVDAPTPRLTQRQIQNREKIMIGKLKMRDRPISAGRRNKDDDPSRPNLTLDLDDVKSDPSHLGAGWTEDQDLDEVNTSPYSHRHKPPSPSRSPSRGVTSPGNTGAGNKSNLSTHRSMHAERDVAKAGGSGIPDSPVSQQADHFFRFQGFGGSPPKTEYSSSHSKDTAPSLNALKKPSQSASAPSLAIRPASAGDHPHPVFEPVEQPYSDLNPALLLIHEPTAIIDIYMYMYV